MWFDRCMKVEEQVCKLELAEKLRKLGVEQRSLWYWCRHEDAVQHHFAYELEWHDLDCRATSDKVAAFTVAELGEMLPWSITRSDKQKFAPVFYKNRGDFSDEFRWSVEYSSYTLDNGEIEVQCVADNEADARAKILIYLLKNKIIQLLPC